MVIIITGASHTGKTLLAQRMLEKYRYPYLSVDHLKMGLIRSGNTALTPYDDEALTGYLWPIVCGMIKTATENRQDLIVEGCYVPFDWRGSFPEEYLPHIRFICLAFTEGYIDAHFEEIRAHACAIEARLFVDDLTKEGVKAENRRYLEGFSQRGENVVMIDSPAFYTGGTAALWERLSSDPADPAEEEADPLIEDARRYIERLFMNDRGGHDAAHSLRVYRNAMEIASGEPGCDKSIAALAALLHDADDHKLFSTENNYNARAFLTEHGIEGGEAERIVDAINSVSFSRNRGRTPGTIEGRVVQDADRLDAIGAVGIARTFAYGGGHGRSIEGSVEHFYDKLLLLKDLMNTDAAKTLAESRHAFMEAFLEELAFETGISGKSL